MKLSVFGLPGYDVLVILFDYKMNIVTALRRSLRRSSKSKSKKSKKDKSARNEALKASCSEPNLASQSQVLDSNKFSVDTLNGKKETGEETYY